MAISPRYKVFDCNGVYQASCWEPEAAAALAAFYGPGTKVRDGHRQLVWHEGDEAMAAAESYDFVANTIVARVNGQVCPAPYRSQGVPA